MFAPLPLLYASQLIYSLDRWFSVTGVLLEEAETVRLRRVLDWNAQVEPKGKKKKKFF